jgi:tRNA (guanine37-N1)-methyltransferase
MRHHSFDISPPVHRGMMELDRTAFCRDIVVLAARVPAAKAGMLLRATQTKKCESWQQATFHLLM